MYPIITNGIIEGRTVGPNSTSQDPLDEDSIEWKEFLQRAAARKAERENRAGRLNSDPVFKALLDELDSRLPGFGGAIRARLQST